MSDEGELATVLDEVLAANADAVAEHQSGDEKVRAKKRGFLFGQVMRATDRKANAGLLNKLLDEKLGGADG